MLIAVLLLFVLLTATISGALGMGGGILLMGLLAALLPVPTAIALHGAIQLGSNGFRALLLRREVDGRTLRRYAAGGALSLLAFVCFTVVVEQTALFLGLGSVAILATLWRRFARPEALKRLSLRSPRVAVGCGALVTAAHLTAGVAGPLLDVFFLETSLSRQGVVATKAATQVLSHGMKLLYFAALVPAGLSTAALPAWVYPLLGAAGLAGTVAGNAVLEKLSEERFRKLTQGAVLVLGVVYFGRGLLDLLAD